MAIDQDINFDKTTIARSLEELFQLVEELEQQVKNSPPSLSPSEEMVAEEDCSASNVPSDLELFI